MNLSKHNNNFTQKPQNLNSSKKEKSKKNYKLAYIEKNAGSLNEILGDNFVDKLLKSSEKISNLEKIENMSFSDQHQSLEKNFQKSKEIKKEISQLSRIMQLIHSEVQSRISPYITDIKKILTSLIIYLAHEENSDNNKHYFENAILLYNFFRLVSELASDKKTYELNISRASDNEKYSYTVDSVIKDIKTKIEKGKGEGNIIFIGLFNNPDISFYQYNLEKFEERTNIKVKINQNDIKQLFQIKKISELSELRENVKNCYSENCKKTSNEVFYKAFYKDIFDENEPLYSEKSFHIVSLHSKDFACL